ncbi:MAG: response regulator, partial [Acidobacteriota bacterium]|nr:response regulator [Acidobacteriota bacterium]
MLRIVFIDDNPDDAMLASMALRHAGLEFDARFAATTAELRAHLTAAPCDAVISDYNLGNATGIDALEITREVAADVPFILVSGTVGDERAAEAIRKGANDYVSKEGMTRLAPV